MLKDGPSTPLDLKLTGEDEWRKISTGLRGGREEGETASGL